MTKQEEIREEMAKDLYQMRMTRYWDEDWCDIDEDAREDWRYETDESSLIST